MKKNTKNGYAISVLHMSKRFVVHHEKPTISERIFSRGSESFYALRNVSFRIKQGERVGVLGPNGSGKTTLLKILSGITCQSSGSVHIQGFLVPIIDLEAGFHPDLNGMENISLNGLIVGMDAQAISLKKDAILAYSGITKFADVPLFTYSQGMKLRLGFSIAIHADPDILVLDEGIAAGDQEFQDMAYKSMKDIFTRGKTVIIASHWLEFIERNCTRILVLDHGKIVADGGPSLVAWYRTKNNLTSGRKVRRQ